MIAARHTLANALHTAAWAYETEANRTTDARLIEQFRRQAVDAKQLAEQIEQADAIELRD
jgi:hypothetical protein